MDSQPIKRLYMGRDAAMQQRQRTLHGHFSTNAAGFAAFNPDLNPAFAQRWQQALAAAETASNGAARTGTLLENTAAVEAAMEQARQQVQRLFYYVGQVFPHNAGRLDQYGKRLYDKARTSHERMISLLRQASEAAAPDQAALAAKGWAAANTAQLAALGQQLAAANTTQEMQKGAGVEDGQAYIGLQNALYRFGQQVSLAAKTLYAEDFARRQPFGLTAGAPAGPEHHELTLAPGAAGYLAFATPLLATTQLRLRLLAPAAGQQAQVGRVAAEGQKSLIPQTLTAEAPERTVLAPELGAAGAVLAVVSLGTAAVRVEVAVVE